MNDIEVFVIRQWQGAGKPYLLVESVDLVVESATMPTVVVPSNQSSSPTENGVRHFSSIVDNIKMQLEVFKERSPEKALIVACECSGEIVPVSHFIKKYENELTVLWVDAHGDLNTHHSSPSGNYHGMPLRTLMGEGPGEIIDMIDANLSSERVGLVFNRDLDKAESDFINQEEIQWWNALSSESLRQIIDFVRGRKVYVHFDLDAVDPQDHSFALYKTPEGPELNSILSLIEAVSATSTIVGVGITEFNSLKERDVQLIHSIMNRCLSYMGRHPWH